MTAFTERCGLHTPGREAALQRLLQRMRDERIERVRFGWCDAHGMLRGKTLMAGAVESVLPSLNTSTSYSREYSWNTLRMRQSRTPTVSASL